MKGKNEQFLLKTCTRLFEWLSKYCCNVHIRKRPINNIQNFGLFHFQHGVAGPACSNLFMVTDSYISIMHRKLRNTFHLCENYKLLPEVLEDLDISERQSINITLSIKILNAVLFSFIYRLNQRKSIKLIKAKILRSLVSNGPVITILLQHCDMIHYITCDTIPKLCM